MNRCNLDTKEYGQMLNRFFILERSGRVPAVDARGWKIEGQKTRVTREHFEDCGRNLRLEVSWLKESYGILPRRECWKTVELFSKKMTINCENTKPA